CVSLRLIRRPTRRTPFPYTTLFRSAYAGTTRGITGACRLRAASAGGLRGLPAHTAVGAASAGLHREPAAAGPQRPARGGGRRRRSEEHTSELQSRENLVCRLLLDKK